MSRLIQRCNGLYVVIGSLNRGSARGQTHYEQTKKQLSSLVLRLNARESFHTLYLQTASSTSSRCAHSVLFSVPLVAHISSTQYARSSSFSLLPLSSPQELSLVPPLPVDGHALLLLLLLSPPLPPYRLLPVLEEDEEVAGNPFPLGSPFSAADPTGTNRGGSRCTHTMLDTGTSQRGDTPDDPLSLTKPCGFEQSPVGSTMVLWFRVMAAGPPPTRFIAFTAPASTRTSASSLRSNPSWSAASGSDPAAAPVVFEKQTHARFVFC